MNPIADRMFACRSADEHTRIRLGVGVFLLNAERKVLLEKRSDCGLWGLPGGGVEPGESVHAAAAREVREETGFEIQITRMIGVYSEPKDRIVTFQDNGDVVHRIDVIVEAEIVSGKLVLSHESEELRFFERGKFPSEVCPPAVIPLQDYLNGVSGVLR
ncbi:MAG: NUDIX domain-containing protein [Verrucomicrobia bacterium]|nr:NUDIX domain-containing protein [Verrucomicrobiota bacterium]